MGAEQKKDSSFGFKDFWIGVAIGLVAACLGIWFTKAAGITPMWAWLALGILGILVGLARRWREAGHDLISLSAGFLLSFGIIIIVTWDIAQGIWPTVSGAVGFFLGVYLLTIAKPKPTT